MFSETQEGLEVLEKKRARVTRLRPPLLPGCLLVFYLTLLPFRLLLGRRCLAAQQPLTAASFLANPPIGRTDERSLNRPTQGESLSHSGHRRCGTDVLP